MFCGELVELFSQNSDCAFKIFGPFHGHLFFLFESIQSRIYKLGMGIGIKINVFCVFFSLCFNCSSWLSASDS